ncbi:TatD family hydrolase [Allopusillimonas ginsengisoli]|uniref:TatD family hydrolase n=1 Tax=Allopusillimonas ginsengisoli TaxID=453575 RepID=UPI0010213D9A|nr:TatD family hydrolase [Allopusillimonas ginsengisoli]TEA77993.1 TatD family deoxyribonuclease [Allopusillimonas ginsengisoli]
MLIDTHCHLDASEFDHDRHAVIEKAFEHRVARIVIPAVSRQNFQVVRDLAHSFDGGAYALGIHPIGVPDAQEQDLRVLETMIVQALDDPRFVAIGEIGLDFFIPELKQEAMARRQEAFYVAQLELAQRYALPVLLHVRRSQDQILKQLRRRPSVTGIAHAFNGSFQQAQHFVEQGFALGFGGAMTFARALQIRRLATQLPLDALVLETDAPDIPPAWLGQPGAPTPRNQPAEVSRIAHVLAELRGMTPEEVIVATGRNAQRVLPRLMH